MKSIHWEIVVFLVIAVAVIGLMVSHWVYYAPLQADDAHGKCVDAGFNTFSSYRPILFGDEAHVVQCRNIGEAKWSDHEVGVK